MGKLVGYLLFYLLAFCVAGEFLVPGSCLLRAWLLLLPLLARAVHLGPLLAGGGIGALTRMASFEAPGGRGSFGQLGLGKVSMGGCAEMANFGAPG